MWPVFIQGAVKLLGQVPNRSFHLFLSLILFFLERQANLSCAFVQTFSTPHGDNNDAAIKCLPWFQAAHFKLLAEIVGKRPSVGALPCAGVLTVCKFEILNELNIYIYMQFWIA